jgi:hypothetical protein
MNIGINHKPIIAMHHNMNEELMQASLIGLRDAMGLQPHETLLIVTDEIKHEIGQAFMRPEKPFARKAC